MPRSAALKDSEPLRPLHERHRPEQTLLYRIIDQQYPEFLERQSVPERDEENGYLQLDVLTCPQCGGEARVIADTSDRCIENQQVIDKILSHLKKKDGLPSPPHALPETRASPQASLFG